jgi:hypothetical protein
MTIREICQHERRGMWTRQQCGYDQHDDHVWRWLNHHLREWSEANRLRMIDSLYEDVASRPER